MKQTITIKINAWIICAVLLILNVITIIIWQPWNGSLSNSRTIKITGSTTIEAEADQYLFNPYYQKEGSDKTAINAELSALTNTITTKLKELGVTDSAIKTDINSYNYGIYYETKSETETSTLNLTVTIKDKTLAQKVQDYIATTNPSGSITPQMSFSTAKQKLLETRAREEALTDAKTKAETSAKQLNSSIGRVISVTDGYSGGIYPMPWMTNTEMAVDSTRSSSSSYTIQPGLNEYSFSIEVTYELR